MLMVNHKPFRQEHKSIKSFINGLIANEAVNGRALILDGPSGNTLRTLLGAGWFKKNIFIPNASDDYYPLKSIQAAWEEFQKNQGFIANLGQNDKNEIIIRKVSLSYYDADKPQHFLQPIYVFEGDRNFIGFLPAIDPKWTE